MYPRDKIFSPFPNSRKTSRGTPFNPHVATQEGETKHLVAPLSISVRIFLPYIRAETTINSPSSTVLTIFFFSFSVFSSPIFLSLCNFSTSSSNLFGCCGIIPTNSGLLLISGFEIPVLSLDLSNICCNDCNFPMIARFLESLPSSLGFSDLANVCAIVL